MSPHKFLMKCHALFDNTSDNYTTLLISCDQNILPLHYLCVQSVCMSLHIKILLKPKIIKHSFNKALRFSFFCNIWFLLSVMELAFPGMELHPPFLTPFVQAIQVFLEDLCWQCC